MLRSRHVVGTFHNTDMLIVVIQHHVDVVSFFTHRLVTENRHQVSHTRSFVGEPVGLGYSSHREPLGSLDVVQAHIQQTGHLRGERNH